MMVRKRKADGSFDTYQKGRADALWMNRRFSGSLEGIQIILLWTQRMRDKIVELILEVRSDKDGLSKVK